MSRLLIDGDIIVYQIGFSINHKIYKVGNYTFLSKREALKYLEEEELDKDLLIVEQIDQGEQTTLSAVDDFIKDILKELKADVYSVFLSSSALNRKKVYPAYKENRDKNHKPLYYEKIRSHLIFNHGAEISLGLEADDLLGLHQTDSTIICSIDKDLLQVPGKHYNWRTQNLISITEEEGMNNFYTQMLTGDATDNIEGIRGIGPKRAKKLLDSCETSEEKELLIINQWRNYLKKTYGDDINTLVKEMIDLSSYLLWIKRSDMGRPLQLCDKGYE